MYKNKARRFKRRDKMKNNKKYEVWALLDIHTTGMREWCLLETDNRLAAVLKAREENFKNNKGVEIRTADGDGNYKCIEF
jgi:hypothetical protein